MKKRFHHDSYLLGIETSCDETAVAILHGDTIVANVISSQLIHSKFGGVVPELASRAHLQNITYLVQQALKQAEISITDIDGIAVTSGPGLIGALVVGTNFAKGIAVRFQIPIVDINHIEGHLYSPFLEHQDLDFPYIALIVSGGHTLLAIVQSFDEYTILGCTRDDAAGEAFDKIANLLGLGYPGGPMIDKYAQNGNPDAFDFPRSMLKSSNFDFSFSGLKTAVRTFLHNTFPQGVPEVVLPDLCASIQEAIVEVLVAKTLKAARTYRISRIVVAGGVSANSRLRERFHAAAQKHRLQIFIPSIQYCTDNAAMIAFLGRYKLLNGISSALTFNATPTFKASAA